MKFLVSGWDATYGRFGGVRVAEIEASNEEEARKKARKKYGEIFGYNPRIKNPFPYGIRVQAKNKK